MASAFWALQNAEFQTNSFQALEELFRSGSEFRTVESIPSDPISPCTSHITIDYR
jgi:hypothetical protein